VGWGIVYYRAESGAIPAEEFLDSCPAKIEARLLAVLEVVRAAPPPAFSGGGMWEAMHGSMNGYYEIRVTGPGRVQYRLFCLLDNADTDEELARRGFDAPQIAVINGMSKPIGEVFSDSLYRKHVRALGDDYRRQLPRRIAD
jgi:Txe/YoeB family toxin of Txe-Axe toxin-antitoxin module